MIAFAKPQPAMDERDPPDPMNDSRNPLEQTYGWGLHGSNRLHYIPSPEEIERECALIREGWCTMTERERRAGASG